MQNKMYLVCNLKANKTKEELMDYERDLLQIPLKSNIELIICPSTPFLYIFQNDSYKLGSQDISRYESGPHTGENTGEQLASLNVEYALVGHSERRKLFKEEEKTIIEKIKKAYHSHIKPIYFIGETTDEKKYKITYSVLEHRITHILDEVPDYKREKIIIVYEPIWAIGTGITPTIEEIADRIDSIKNILLDKYKIRIPVLYGGSINKENIKEIKNIPNIDGYVLGESAKEIKDLLEIYNKI